jgi:hypothetical protein
VSPLHPYYFRALLVFHHVVPLMIVLLMIVHLIVHLIIHDPLIIVWWHNAQQPCMYLQMNRNIQQSQIVRMGATPAPAGKLYSVSCSMLHQEAH